MLGVIKERKGWLMQRAEKKYELMMKQKKIEKLRREIGYMKTNVELGVIDRNLERLDGKLLRGVNLGKWKTNEDKKTK